MPYARIDTSALRHTKIRRLSAEAFRLWIAGLAHAQDSLTDGLLDDVTPEALGCAVTPDLVSELILARLWMVVAPGIWQIHDYGDWNDLKQDVQRKRAAARVRYARWRSKRDHALANASAGASANAFANALARIDPVRTEFRSVQEAVQDSKDSMPAAQPAGLFWQDFLDIGRAYGFDHRLAATPKEYGHLVQLTGAYSLEELHAMATAFWSTPHLLMDRNLGLFASKAGALFKHVHEGSAEAFGAPVSARQSAEAAAREAVRAWGNQ